MELTDIGKPQRPYEPVPLDNYDNEGLDSSVRPRAPPKPRSWRRIGLMIITGLIVLGVPLFIWLQVKTARSCQWAEWDRPELIEDDVHLLPIGPNTVGVFWSITETRDKYCKKVWLYQTQETERKSHLFYQVFTYKDDQWQSFGKLADLSDKAPLSTPDNPNVYITSIVKLNTSDFIVLSQSYEDTWGLYRIVSPESGSSISFYEIWHSVGSDYQMYDLILFGDGSAYLMNESASDEVPQPSLSVRRVTPEGLGTPMTVGISQITTDEDVINANRAVYWWVKGDAHSPGNSTVKQLIVGHSKFMNITKTNSGYEQFFYSLCTIAPSATNPSEDTIACPKTPVPWVNYRPASEPELQPLLLDYNNGSDRYLVKPQMLPGTVSQNCQWSTSNGNLSPLSTDSTDDWAKEFCLAQGTPRPYSYTVFKRANPRTHAVDTFQFNPDILERNIGKSLLKDPAPFGEPGTLLVQIYTPDMSANIPPDFDYTGKEFIVLLLDPRFRTNSNVLMYYKKWVNNDPDFDFATSLGYIQTPFPGNDNETVS